MSAIFIRDLEERDRKAYLELSRIFYNSDAVIHSVPEANFERTFDMCLEGSPYVRGLALERDGEFAGYALLSFTWSNEAGGLSVLLEEVFVPPEHQGAGLGTAFLQFVEDEYCHKAKRLRLEVTKSNKDAVRLYEYKGYKSIDYLQMIKDFDE